MMSMLGLSFGQSSEWSMYFLMTKSPPSFTEQTKRRLNKHPSCLQAKPYPLLVVVLTCWAHIPACELDEVTDIVVDALLGLELVTFFRELEGTYFTCCGHDVDDVEVAAAQIFCR